MAVISYLLQGRRAARRENLPKLGDGPSRKAIWEAVILGWVGSAGTMMFFLALGQSIDQLTGVYAAQGGVQIAKSGSLSGSQMFTSWPFKPATMCLFIVGIAVIVGVQTLRVYRGATAAAGMENRLRHQLVSQLFADGPLRLARHRTGMVVSMATEGTEKVSQYRQIFLPDAILGASVPIALVTVLAIFVDGVSALVLALFIPAIPMLVVGFEKAFSKVSADARKNRAALSVAYLDAIQGLETLTLIGAVGRVGSHLAAQGEKNRRAIMALLAGNQLLLFVIDIAFSLFMLVAASMVAWLGAGSGRLGAGSVVTIIGFAILLLEPMDLVGGFFYIGMGGIAATRGIQRFLVRGSDKKAVLVSVGITALGGAQSRGQSGILSSSESTENTVQNGGTNCGRFAVRAKNLSFSYGDCAVLNNVNFEFYRGDFVAVMGASGSGKSTLLSLIKGDLKAAGGGLEIGCADLGIAGASCALLSQSAWIFTATIAENLRLGRREATDAQLWEALDLVALTEEVRQFPMGLETPVGEQGVGLSGGQAQRLALARAFLSGRPLLLLDEPTSQVDRYSEAKIMEAIAKMVTPGRLTADLETDLGGPGRTVIMVTHRVEPAAAANRVVFLENGKIKELSSVERGGLGGKNECQS